MPASTSTYGFPYLENAVDPPDIGGATQDLAEAVEAVLSDGTKTLNPGAITNQAKVAVTYQNGWVDWGAPFQGARYWKDKNGVVHLDGLIKNGALNVAAFTLPAGYRPASTLAFPTITSSSTLGRVDVESSGAVKVIVGATTLVTLSGINFKAEL